MPRVPKSPVAIGFALYKTWRKLPPSERERVLAAARKHGPAVAAAARRRGPTVGRLAAELAKRVRKSR
jgi:hypothetical protein